MLGINETITCYDLPKPSTRRERGLGASRHGGEKVVQASVQSGGKKMKISNDDKLRNDHSEMTATKQWLPGVRSGRKTEPQSARENPDTTRRCGAPRVREGFR
jgi:hypothetical protein